MAFLLCFLNSPHHWSVKEPGIQTQIKWFFETSVCRFLWQVSGAAGGSNKLLCNTPGVGLLMTQWQRICLQCRRCRTCRFNPWVGKIPWSRKWQSPLIFLPGKFHGQGSLAGYSPQGLQRIGWNRACLHAYSGYPGERWTTSLPSKICQDLGNNACFLILWKKETWGDENHWSMENCRIWRHPGGWLTKDGIRYHYRLVPNRKRSTSRMYIVTLLI